ncbi:hypothetical protein [Salirhabdus salicampi]|uniref:hypothetical protein n=1 Tax=Salirhabdus salicampi TaxID=476102 RepID=UPI0020C49FFB|nr:hypothetical protein [Salirhabdus salicampi]MCP8616867.1 hypothetical protein [Salirhabdus salicampi]
MKSTLRSYSLGMMTATLLLGGYFLFFYESTTEEEVEEHHEKPIRTDDALSLLREDGYIIFTQEELEQFEQNIKHKEEKSEEYDQQEKQSVTLKIERGMNTTEVGDALVELNIIDDKDAFITFMEKHEYTKSIIYGEYDIKTDATYEEIASIITNK